MLVGVTEAGWDLPKTVYQKLAINMGLSFKDICNGEFLTSAEKRTPIPKHWNAAKVSLLYAVNVAPWWDRSDMAEVFVSCTKNKEVVINRVRFSVGEIRTATWRVSGESIGQLAGMVFHDVRGSELVSIDYIAKKGQVSEAIQSRPRVGAPLITAKEMDDAMAFDSEVRTSLSKLKRKRSEVSTSSSDAR